jgi:4-amino-4-deoxy-L-arabinose transferase-like glycosyltransferase
LSAIAFFLFAAGGTLVKGPIALVLPGLIVLAVCAWERRWHSLDPPAIGVGLLVFFALATPWFVLLERAIPGAARNFLLGENIERFAEGVDHTGRPFFYYVPILILGLLPWTTLAPGALWQETRMAFSRQQRASEERFFVRAAAVWWLLPLIFFSIAATKLASYILPCFPGAGLLLGRAVARQMNQDESYGRGRWTWITSYAVLLPLLAIAATLMIARSTKLTEEQVMHLSSGMLVTGLAGGLATMLTSWRWGNRAGIPVLLLVHYLFVACAMRGHAALEPREEMRPVAAQLLARGEPTSPLVCYKFYKPAMSFYLRRLIPVVGRQELEQLLSKENRVLCVIDRDDESEILAVKEWHVRRLAGNDDCSVLEIVADTSVRASSPQGSRQGHLRPLHGGEMNQLHE